MTPVIRLPLWRRARRRHRRSSSLFWPSPEWSSAAASLSSAPAFQQRRPCRWLVPPRPSVRSWWLVRPGRPTRAARAWGAGSLGAGATRGRAGEARLEAHRPIPDLAVQYEHAPPPQLPASAARRGSRLRAQLPPRGLAFGAQQYLPRRGFCADSSATKQQPPPRGGSSARLNGAELLQPASGKRCTSAHAGYQPAPTRAPLVRLPDEEGIGNHQKI